MSAHLAETKVFGHGIERVAVRPVTPNIYWLTHCVGNNLRVVNEI